jgi:hypothetical protein
MSELQYPKEHACPKCGIVSPFIPGTNTPHYGAIRCPEHGHTWIRRPAEEKPPRRKGSTGLIGTLPKMQQDFCWFCLRRKEVLRSLKPAIGFEVHHIIPVEDGGTDERQNIILLCRECHLEVHRRQEAFKRYRVLMTGGATE